MKIITLLFGFLLSITCVAQEKTSTETRECPQPGDTSCEEEKKITKKVTTRDEVVIYSETVNANNDILLININFVGAETVCFRDEESIVCSFPKPVPLTSSPKKSKKIAAYHSDKDLAEALGISESEVAALNIDWSYAQVIFGVIKSPTSKKLFVEEGRIAFYTTKKMNGTLRVSFAEGCPSGGIPRSKKKPAPELTEILVILPSSFAMNKTEVNFRKSKITKIANCRVP